MGERTPSTEPALTHALIIAVVLTIGLGLLAALPWIGAGKLVLP